MSVLEDGPVDAFVGFFDTQFKGSPQNPTDFPINLSTAPDPTGEGRGKGGPAPLGRGVGEWFWDEEGGP